MGSSTPRVVLDTNVLISALLFGGKPRTILRYAVERKLIAVSSAVLLAELAEVLAKRFAFSAAKVDLVRRMIQRRFVIAHPTQSVTVLADEADNRVLEAAVWGNCSYIVTGDKELLALNKYRSVQIVTPNQFLQLLLTRAGL